MVGCQRERDGGVVDVRGRGMVGWWDVRERGMVRWWDVRGRRMVG